MTPKQMTIGLLVVLVVVLVAAGGGGALLVFAIPLGCGYLAYRIIRGGFARPQSTRLNVFGWIGCGILLLVAVWFAEWGLRLIGVL